MTLEITPETIREVIGDKTEEEQARELAENEAKIKKNWALWQVYKRVKKAMLKKQAKGKL